MPAISKHLSNYELISGFLTKNAVPFVWMAVCTITLASTFDLLRNFSIAKSEEASKQIEHEQYREALASATLAVRSNPFSARAYLERGRSLAKQLRLKEALECFNNALSLSPNDLTALDQRAALALKLNQSQRTIDDINKLMTLAPEQTTSFQVGNRAVAYFNLGEYRKALVDYDQALKLEPSSYSLQLSQAFCLAADQQYELALQACGRLLRMDPENNEVLTQNGYCRQRLNDQKGALADFNRAIKRDPTTARWYGYRANLFLEMNKPLAALADCKKAADLEPTNERAQYTAGKLCKNLKDPSALKYYDRLSQLPNFRSSFNKLLERATLYIDRGSYQKALNDLTAALKLKQDPETYYLQALCYSHLQQPKPARAALASATALGAATARAFLYQAQVESVLGDNISAVDHFSQVLKLEPQNTAALVERGRFYLKSEQWASAGMDFKNALALGSTDETAKAGLSKCTQMLGKSARISLILPHAFDKDLKKMNYESLVKEGYKLYREGDNNTSAFYFAEAVARKPESAEMRRYLAHAMAGAGNHSEAIAAFQTLSQNNLLNNQDKLLYSQELASGCQLDKAISVISELKKANPQESTYSYELAKMLAASGQTDRAIALCATSLQQSDGSPRNKQLENLYHSLNSEKEKIAPVEKNLPKPETEG